MPTDRAQKLTSFVRASTGPLPPSTGTVIARRFAQLRAEKRAALDPLDNWVIYNTDAAGWVSTWLDSPVEEHEGACYIWMTHRKAPSHPFFRDPDTYRLSMRIKLPAASGVPVASRNSPVIILATFIGHPDEEDVPRWVQYYNAGETYRFAHERGFLAEILCERTPILVGNSENISSRMLAWAGTAAIGTNVENVVQAHCEDIRSSRRVFRYVKGQVDMTRWVRGETLRSTA
ncbi:hypothetical protein C8R46DRAFT_1040506 [Mycena filopes]|nr:hypothetical protein C8R46DRAFT_1040506 [Mycena filopes]